MKYFSTVHSNNSVKTFEASNSNKAMVKAMKYTLKRGGNALVSIYQEYRDGLRLLRREEIIPE